jgi:tetratricopeptide (TPR) repeat protein
MEEYDSDAIKIERLIEERRIEEALKIAEKQDVALLYNMGVELIGKSNPLALKIFDKMVNLNPYDAMSYYTRANAYASLELYAKAIRDYKKVLKLNPNDKRAYKNLQMAHACLKQQKDIITKTNNTIKTFLQISQFLKKGLLNVKSKLKTFLLHSPKPDIQLNQFVRFKEVLDNIFGVIFGLSGPALIILGVVLYLGNRTGDFPTFPFAGFITMMVGWGILYLVTQSG